MKFCPNCGAFCQMDREKKCYVCPKCEWEENIEGGILKVARENTNTEKIIVVGKKDKQGVMPKTKINCEKCGHGEAEWWMVQTRSADESSTQFYRCTSCGYTWRDYG